MRLTGIAEGATFLLLVPIAATASPPGGAECRGLEVQTFERGAGGEFSLIDAACYPDEAPSLPWVDAPGQAFRDPPPPPGSSSVTEFEATEIEAVDTESLDDLIRLDPSEYE